MKAAVLKQIGDDKLDVRTDAGVVQPGPDEVHIQIRSAGICHSDLSAMDGTLPALAPGVMGHEGAGVVLGVGDHVTDLEPGDHVVVSFVPPCGKCGYCVRGKAYLCEVHTVNAFVSPRFEVNGEPVFGFAGCGTFAEEMVLPREGAVRIPPDVPFELAALLGCGVLTGVGAVLNTAQVEPGSTVVVVGCGGVGISVIQGARVAGASQIVAVDPLADKHAVAKRFGATHAVTPDGFDELKQELTGGAGFDYAFEVVGSASTIRAAYDAAKRGGTAVIVGAGSEQEKVEFTAQELFVTARQVLPSFYGSADPRREIERMLTFWRAGQLDLEGMVSKRVSLNDINDGLNALKVGNAEIVRQIVTFD